MLHQYVTYQEFADAPTGLNLQNLIPGGTSTQEQAAVDKLLQRASAIVDRHCNQTLCAESLNDMFQRVYFDGYGNMVIRAHKFPVQSVTSLSYSYMPQGQFTTVDSTAILIDSVQYPQIVRAYGVANGAYGAYYGNGQYIGAGYSHLRQYTPFVVQMQYVAGFVCTTLSVAAVANAITVTLTDATGVASGQTLALYDGIYSENLYVQSVSGNVVTLTSPVQNAHDIGCGVSDMPEEIKQATISIATFLLNERSAGEVDFGFGDSRPTMGKVKNSSEYKLALEWLQPFRRIF